MEKIVNHTFWRTHGLLIARILMGLLFLMAGISKLQGGVESVEMMVAGAGLPMPLLLAWASIIIEIGAGAMLILGYKAKEAVFALIIYTLIVSLFFHPDVTDVNLLKNLAIVGGLMYFIAHGTGGTWKIQK